MIDLKRLHNLYQTISPASLLEHEVPLVGFSQLERRGRTRTGAIEWVVTLGARTGERDSWWTSRSDAREIEALVAEQLAGTAVTRETIVEQVRTSWIQGHLDVRNLELSSQQSAPERQPLDLFMYLVDRVRFSITLVPCDECPFSLLTVLSHLIPPYLSSTSAQTTVRTLQPQLAATREERDKFASDNALLREEVNELKRKLRESVGRQREERLSEPSRGGPLPPPLSQQAPATGALPRRETSVSLSPQKKGRPGIDYKAVMRPGTKGYAGSSSRVGRNLDDEWEEPDSDSD